MPKSIEHYQQETGRAGRDGLEAECVLLYSGQDVVTWKWLIEKSAAEAEEAQAEAIASDGSGSGTEEWSPHSARRRHTEHGGHIQQYVRCALKHLEEMDRYARGAMCRHRALVSYFGQKYERDNCQACDHCLGDTEPVPNALIVAQKILSCVARVKERWGVGQVISVLRGEKTEKVRTNQHDKLSTYGLLREHSPAVLRNWIQQLISQQALVQEGIEYPILKLNAASWEVMKGERQVRLVQPVQKEKMKKAGAEVQSWEGVDHELFEILRTWRKGLAEQRQVQPYMVVSDATLRGLARIRPSSLDKLRMIYGIGAKQLNDFGLDLLVLIDEQSRARGLARDQAANRAAPVPKPKSSASISPVKELALELFQDGAAIVDVMHETSRSRGTVYDYLAEFIQETRPASIANWVDAALYARIAAAAKKVGMERLKPIFIELEEKVPYEDIRLVVAHLRCRP
jgi:ATP-dependent DNA helicase RecQ